MSESFDPRTVSSSDLSTAVKSQAHAPACHGKNSVSLRTLTMLPTADLATTLCSNALEIENCFDAGFSLTRYMPPSSHNHSDSSTSLASSSGFSGLKDEAKQVVMVALCEGVFLSTNLAHAGRPYLYCLFSCRRLAQRSSESR